MITEADEELTEDHDGSTIVGHWVTIGKPHPLLLLRRSSTIVVCSSPFFPSMCHTWLPRCLLASFELTLSFGGVGTIVQVTGAC